MDKSSAYMKVINKRMNKIYIYVMQV